MGKLNSSKGKGWMERGFVQQLVGQWLCKREDKRKCSWRGPVHWNVEKIPYEITRVTETLWEHSNIDIAFFRSLSLFLFLILIFFFFTSSIILFQLKSKMIISEFYSTRSVQSFTMAIKHLWLVIERHSVQKARLDSLIFMYKLMSWELVLGSCSRKLPFQLSSNIHNLNTEGLPRYVCPSQAQGNWNIPVFFMWEHNTAT